MHAMKLCEAMDLVFTYSDGQRHAVVNEHRYYFYTQEEAAGTLWTGTVWVLRVGCDIYRRLWSLYPAVS